MGDSSGSKLTVGQHHQAQGRGDHRLRHAGGRRHGRSHHGFARDPYLGKRRFKGSAEIDIAEIHGEFNGTLTVRQKLVIYSTGKVSGKIRYSKLVVEEGGSWRARSKPVLRWRAFIGRAIGGAQSPFYPWRPELEKPPGLSLGRHAKSFAPGSRRGRPVSLWPHGQRGLGRLHTRPGRKKRSANTSTCTVTEVLPTRVMCEKNDRMSPTRPALENEFIDRHRRHAALHIARGQRNRPGAWAITHRQKYRRWRCSRQAWE